MSSLAVPHNPRLPWLSPPYLWFVGHPWPACLAGHRTHVPGLWVVVYDPWTQRHTVRCLRAVAGTPAARQPYLCRTHAHAELQQRAARRIPPRREQPPPRVQHATPADRLAWVAQEAAADEARDAAQEAWNAWLHQRAQAIADADADAPDWHRPQWFRPLRLPQLSPPNDKETPP